MSTTAIVLLGVVALGSLVQAVFLVLLAREGLRMAQRLDELNLKIGTELRPIAGQLTEASANLAEAAELTTAQMRRIDVLLGDVAERLSDTGGIVRDVLVPTATRLVTMTAAVRTIRKGFELYRRLRS